MKDILDAAEQAESLSQSFAIRIGTFVEQVAEREAQALANAEKYSKLPGEHDQGARQVVQQVARNAAKREAHEYHRNLATSTEPERIERLKTLKALDSRAVQLEPLFESPVQMLGRVGLGSPERSRYQEQLASAGPRELQNHAQWALAHGDKILAAAVLSRLDALPAGQRPLRASDFAQQVVGDELKQVREALRKVRAAAQHAINVNRDFERHRVDATAKIALGLARRQS